MRDPYITKITKNKQQDFKDFQQKGQSKFFDLVILNVIWNHVDVETLPLTHFTHPSQAFTWDYGFFQQRTRNDLNWWTTNKWTRLLNVCPSGSQLEKGFRCSSWISNAIRCSITSWSSWFNSLPSLSNIEFLSLCVLMAICRSFLSLLNCLHHQGKRL